MRRGWGTTGDVALAAAVALVDLLLFSTLAGGSAGGGRVALILGYGLVGAAPLVWRRRAPALVYALVWAQTTGAALVPGYRPMVGLLVTLFTVAALRGRVTATAALLAAAAPVGLVVIGEVRAAPAGEAYATGLGVGLFLVLLHLAVWTVGRVIRASRERALALERRRETAAREAVAAERNRIAHELHDIVANTVTLMCLHAAGAGRTMLRDPPRAARALAQVGDLGTQAMAELRRMLPVLRAADPPPADARRTLDDIDDLLAAAAAAGVMVALDRSGTPGHLDPSVETAAYRVVQEALTNVVRHAGPGTRVGVRLEWTELSLLVEVTDDGRGTVDPSTARLSTGHGLLGLRERLAVVGGDFDAGPGSTGGFRVGARLPRGGRPPADGADAPAGEPVPGLVEVGGERGHGSARG